ncbi:MAG: hypothetical protein HY737_05740 [Candidatus Omnitrophica bacterium]|nr:hypothetical protein [Candidatus Omnitrophota bacterium]
MTNPQGSCCLGDVANDEVRIGEEGNLVRLPKEAWNTLVEKIQQGELAKL